MQWKKKGGGGVMNVNGSICKTWQYLMHIATNCLYMYERENAEVLCELAWISVDEMMVTDSCDYNQCLN